MRNGYIVDVLPSVNFHEIIKLGGKAIRNYEGVFCREIYKRSLFRKVTEKFFASRQQYKDEGNAFMQCVVESLLNSLYRIQIREDIDDFCKE